MNDTLQTMFLPLIQPYLFFNGCCEEALEFYEQHLGAKREMLMRYDEAPDPPPPDMLASGWETKVMHACILIGQSRIMASDGCSADDVGFNGFALSLTLPDEQEVNRVFTLLTEGGSIQMPLGKTFWSPCFGMLTDRFGVAWMIAVPD